MKINTFFEMKYPIPIILTDADNITNWFVVKI